MRAWAEYNREAGKTKKPFKEFNNRYMVLVNQ
jgi:hypothetical protein